jgi:hypothetical protein
VSLSYYWKMALPTGQVVDSSDDPRIHIAKSTTSFIWAQDPGLVMRTCLDKWREPIVIDECGREYTGAEFAEIAKEAAAIWELDSVGTWFS